MAQSLHLFGRIAGLWLVCTVDALECLDQVEYLVEHGPWAPRQR